MIISSSLRNNDRIRELKDISFNDVPIKITKVKENAIIPSKMNEDAGYDIYACVDTLKYIGPHKTIGIPCGIATSFSDEFCIALKEIESVESISIARCSGIISSKYKKEWVVYITNTTDSGLFVYNDKILNPKSIYKAMIASAAEDDTDFQTIKSVYFNYEIFEEMHKFYPISKPICQAFITLSFKGNFEEVAYDELQKEN